MTRWKDTPGLHERLNARLGADPRPSPQVAADYGTTAVNIRTIRQRRSWDWL